MCASAPGSRLGTREPALSDRQSSAPSQVGYVWACVTAPRAWHTVGALDRYIVDRNDSKGGPSEKGDAIYSLDISQRYKPLTSFVFLLTLCPRVLPPLAASSSFGLYHTYPQPEQEGRWRCSYTQLLLWSFPSETTGPECFSSQNREFFICIFQQRTGCILHTWSLF